MPPPSRMAQAEQQRQRAVRSGPRRREGSLYDDDVIRALGTIFASHPEELVRMLAGRTGVSNGHSVRTLPAGASQENGTSEGDFSGTEDSSARDSGADRE
jgi:hypothetical protein